MKWNSKDLRLKIKKYMFIVYKKKLKSIKSKFSSQEMLFKNYQIIRNFIYIDRNSYVIFLYP